MSDPVMPIGKYCTALETWMRIATKTSRGGGTFVAGKSEPIITEDALRQLLLGIRKSCLLKRMIYGGEELRTRKCPIHDGHWSGCYIESCPGRMRHVRLRVRLAAKRRACVRGVWVDVLAGSRARRQSQAARKSAWEHVQAARVNHVNTNNHEWLGSI